MTKTQRFVVDLTINGNRTFNPCANGTEKQCVAIAHRLNRQARPQIAWIVVAEEN